MNFILGFILLIIMVSMFDAVPTTQISGFSGVRNDDDTITYYAQSYKTGLRHDDKIIKMDGTAIYSILDLNYMFATTNKDVHEVVVKRDGKRITLHDVCFHDDETGETLDIGLVTKDKNPLTIVSCSKDIFKSMGHIVVMSIKQIMTGKAKKEDVSGPVGVVSAINETTQESESTEDAIFNLVYMASLITINVGIFNLLPIPGLDGGRLLFCFIELIRRKPVKPEHEGYVHLAGMVLLFGIMIFATYNDIVRLITGG